MALAWYFVGYNPYMQGALPFRYCAIDDFTSQFRAADGAWDESEVAGNRAIVKVRAPLDLLSTLNAQFRRLPKDDLRDPLAGVSAGELLALDDELIDAGYTRAEIDAGLGGDLSAHTLGDVLGFLAQRRQKPRYDSNAGEFVFDGPVQWVKPLSVLDRNIIEIQGGGGGGGSFLHFTQRFLRSAPDVYAWGSGGPTTGILDDFDRSDEGPPPSSSWLSPTVSDGLKVVSNQVQSDGTNGFDVWNTSYGPDSECYITIGTLPGTNNYIGPGVRMQDTGSLATVDGYVSLFTQLSGTDKVEVLRIDNGAATQLGADISQDFSIGDSLGIEIAGSSIATSYHNGSVWSELGTRSDSTYSSAGLLALIIQETTGAGDDFGGGTMVSSVEGPLIGGKLVNSGILQGRLIR